MFDALSFRHRHMAPEHCKVSNLARRLEGGVVL